MKKIIFALAFFILAFSTTAVSSDKDAVSEVIAKMDTALNTNNLDEYLDLFIDDAVEMPNDEPVLVGIEAIRARDGDFFANYTDEISQVVEAVKMEGNLAVVRLSYHEEVTPKAGGPAVVYVGKGIVVLEKQGDGHWKISSNIWNLDQPLE